MKRQITATKSNKTNRNNRTKKVTVEDVRNRAYEIYLSRGRTPGNEMEDWTMAEKELGFRTRM